MENKDFKVTGYRDRDSLYLFWESKTQGWGEITVKQDPDYNLIVDNERISIELTIAIIALYYIQGEPQASEEFLIERFGQNFSKKS